MRSISFAFALIILAAGCSSTQPAATYIITTESHLMCCRTLRYATNEFPVLQASTVSGQGVVVRLDADTVRGKCPNGAEVHVMIANNSSEDIFVPVSRELHGDTIKLFPWRMYYDSDADQPPVRIARQLQYGDLVERTDARLTFYRLPAGKQVNFHGVVTPRWLCTPPINVTDDLLNAELDPTVYAEQTRALRASRPPEDAAGFPPTRFRYDVAYTHLDFLEGLPVKENERNSVGDTVQVQVAVDDPPATFLNASQQVASSNVVMLVVE
jgi:hypothetical protein